MAELDEREIYEQAVQTYQFFLNWRAKLLAGYFAILVALIYSFVGICQRQIPNFLCLVLITGFLLTLFFRAIEHRNREQYRDCMNIGRHIEENRALEKIGMFSEMARRECAGQTEGSHSAALDHLFRMVCLACLSLLLFTLPGMTQIIFGHCGCVH